MSNGSCTIRPRVANSRGELVASRLWSDLAKFTNDFNTTRKVYTTTRTEEFIRDYYEQLVFDENREPTLDSIIENTDMIKLLPADVVKARADEMLESQEGTPSDKAASFNETAPLRKQFAAIPGPEKAFLVERNDAEVRSATNKAALSALNGQIRSMLAANGISVGFLTEVEKRMGIDGVTDFSQAERIIHDTVELIRIAKGEKGEMALPEEFSHAMVEVMLEDPLVQRGLKALSSEEAQRRVLGEQYDRYYKEYGGDSMQLAKECLGKLVKDHLLQNKPIAPSHPVGSILKRILSRIKELFGHMDEIAIQRSLIEAQTHAESFARHLMSGELNSKISRERIAKLHERANLYAIANLSSDSVNKSFVKLSNLIRKQNSVAFQTGTFGVLKNLGEQIVENYDLGVTLEEFLTMSRKDRTLLIENYAKFHPITAEEPLISAYRQLDSLLSLNATDKKLNEWIKSKDISQQSVALGDFLSELKSALSDIQKKTATLNPYDPNIELNVRCAMVRQVKNLHDMAVNVSVALNDIIASIEQDLNDPNLSESDRINMQATIDAAKKEVSTFAFSFHDLNMFYKKSAEQLLRDFIAPFASSAGKKIIVDIGAKAGQEVTVDSIIEEMRTDASWWDAWLSSMAHSKHDMLKIFDNVVKQYKDKADRKAIEYRKRLVNLGLELEGRGMGDVKWMFQKDSNGHNTGYLLSTYDMARFRAEEKKIKEELRAKYPEWKDSQRQQYKFELDDWYMQNCKTTIFIRKEKKGKKKKDPGLIDDGVSEWLSDAEQDNDDTEDDFEVREYQPGEELDYDDVKVIIHYDQPNDNFINKEFLQAMSDPLKKEAYLRLMNIYRELNRNLPTKILKWKAGEEFPLEVRPPMILRDTFERLKDAKGPKGVLNVAGKAIGDSLVRRSDDEMFGSKGLPGYNNGTESTEVIGTIPVYYQELGKNESYDDLNTDLVSTLSQYAGMACNFNSMCGVVHTLEVAKDAIKGISFQIDNATHAEVGGTSTNDQSTVSLDKSRLYERITNYLEANLYGKKVVDSGTIKIAGLDTRIDVNKAADTLNMLTSYNCYALNLLSGLSNVNTGILMMNIETFCREFWDPKDNLAADAIYYRMMPGFLANLGKRERKDKLSLFDEYFDVSQDNDKEINATGFNRKTMLTKLLSKSPFYLFNTCGEHYLSNRTALALASHYKMKNPKTGQEVSLWEALEVRERKVGDEIVTELWVDPAKWVKQDGTVWTDADANAFKNKCGGINRKLHGIYNNIDRNEMQRHWWGRMAIMFRKWIVPSLNRRFSGAERDLDIGLDYFSEGYYVTLGRYLGDVFGMRDFITQDEKGQLHFNVLKGEFVMKFAGAWNKLSDKEKINMRRAITELSQVFLLFLSTVALGVTGFEDDDDDNYFKALSVYELRRLYSENACLTPIPNLALPELVRILKSPAAGINTISPLLNFGFGLLAPVFRWVFPDMLERREHGRWRGFNDSEIALFEALPLYNTVYKALNPDEQTAYLKQTTMF